MLHGDLSLIPLTHYEAKHCQKILNLRIAIYLTTSTSLHNICGVVGILISHAPENCYAP